MGYYSQVMIGIRTNVKVPTDIQDLLNQCDSTMFKQDIIEHDEKREKSFTELDPYGEEDWNDDVNVLITYYSWGYTKWYDGDDDVDKIMEFLRSIKDTADCGLIRIGEELDDYESDGEPWELNMQVHRNIYIDD